MEKLSYWSLSSTIFLFVCSPHLHFVYSVLRPPPNHWRCEKLGITQEGWKACDTLKETCFVLLDSGSYLWYALENVWELVLYYPWIWEGLPKREWERDILYSFWILFSKFLLCHHLGQVFACVQSLCTSPAEKAATQEAVFIEHLASGVVHWGYVCQPARQSRRKLKHNCPDDKEGKTLRLYKDVCRPPATKGRGYLQTFLELSKLVSVLSLHLLVKQTWFSCVSKPVKQPSSILGIF